MSLDLLFAPAGHADEWLSGLFSGAPLAVALLVALALGARHATDPDHLVAVTSLIAGEERGGRRAAALGAWWGVGHALTLLALGVPLIALGSRLPGWLESGAEKAVGVVIALLAVRLLLRWRRSQLRLDTHRHPPAVRHRHVHRGGAEHPHVHVRGPLEALGIGALHGLAGTGAAVLLMVAALPDSLDAAIALAAFSLTSVASMAACSAALGWALTRHRAPRPGRATPVFAVLALTFGAGYAGLL